MQNKPQPGLVRGLGPWAAIAVNVANMIGTGVFLKARVMTCNVGSPIVVLCVWAAAGLLALAGTFSYAEIAAMIPEVGGDYLYFRRAYGRLVGFLYGWMAFGIAHCGSQAALAVGLAIFTNVATGGALEAWDPGLTLFGHALPLNGLTLTALGTLWFIAGINCLSVEAGGRTAVAVTIAKLALVFAVGVGAFCFVRGSWSHFALSGAGGTCTDVESSARGGIAGFGAAMLGALWAYDGWNNVAPLAAEIRDPHRNLPRAFIGGLTVVAALYLFVNTAYFYTLTPLQVASVSTTTSVATEVAKRFLGPMAVALMGMALMVSSFGALQASVLANSRIPYAMARDGLFFKSLGSLSVRSRVPAKAILAQAFWASVLALSGSYDVLTDSAVFALWLGYGLSTGALFVFRKTMPDAPRPYRAFAYPFVPLLFLVATTALLVNTFVAAPREALRGVAFLVIGLPFYWYWSRGVPR